MTKTEYKGILSPQYIFVAGDRGMRRRTYILAFTTAVALGGIAANVEAKPSTRDEIEAVLVQNAASARKIKTIDFNIVSTLRQAGQRTEVRKAHVVRSGESLWYSNLIPIRKAGKSEPTDCEFRAFIRDGEAGAYAEGWPAFGYEAKPDGEVATAAQSELRLSMPFDPFPIVYGPWKGGFLEQSKSWPWDSATPPSMATTVVDGRTLHTVTIRLGDPRNTWSTEYVFDSGKGCAVVRQTARNSGGALASQIEVELLDPAPGVWVPSRIKAELAVDQGAGIGDEHVVKVEKVNHPIDAEQFGWSTLKVPPDHVVRYVRASGKPDSMRVIDGQLLPRAVAGKVRPIRDRQGRPLTTAPIDKKKIVTPIAMTESEPGMSRDIWLGLMAGGSAIVLSGAVAMMIRLKKSRAHGGTS